MKIIRANIYFFLFLILITGGCDCDEDEWKGKCLEIEKVTKSFTFEIWGKYRLNNEPIQSDGSVTLYISNTVYEKDGVTTDGNCKYLIHYNKYKATINFNEYGLAVITTREYVFDNKYDKIIIQFTVQFPDSTHPTDVANSKTITVNHESDEYTIMNFNYLSKNDL